MTPVALWQHVISTLRQLPGAADADSLFAIANQTLNKLGTTRPDAAQWQLMLQHNKVCFCARHGR